MNIFLLAMTKFFLVESKRFGPMNDKRKNCLLLFQTGEFFLTNLLKTQKGNTDG